MKFRKTSSPLLPTFKRQAGMTMMEIIAVMGIIVAVVVGALSLFTSVQSNNSAVTVLKDIVAIRTAVQQMYIGQGEYSGNNTQVNEQLYDAKTVLSSMTWQSNKTIRTSWDGTLKFSADGNKPQNFKITLTKVPVDICAQLVSSASNGWKSVQIGGNMPQTTFPVTPATARNNCKNTSQDITWVTLN